MGELSEEAMVNGLSRAIENGEIEIWMQPLVDFVKGEIVASEALVRWNHPECGYLSPDKFITVFEKTGQISELDRFVWRHSCKVIADRYHRTGDMPLPFSVNVSRAEILAPDLMDYLLSVVEDTGLPQGTLRLEVTESAYVAQPEELVRVVTELRNHGFLVEMDDFGSGYSSLNMLRSLPVDILKLDMGFLRHGKSDSSDAVILNSVIRMAHGLNMPVIAEGVETIEQAEMLKTMGCRLLQGYFFAKPMPFDQYFKLLEDTKAARHTYEPELGDDRVARLLDQRGDTAFFFSHCAGPAFVFSVSANMYEVMLANDELYDELQINSDEVNLFQTDPLSLMDGESRDVFRRAARRALVTKATRCTTRLADTGKWIECTVRAISVDEAGGVLVCYVRDSTEESELARVRETTPNIPEDEPVRDEFTGLLSYHALDALAMGELGKDGGTLMLVDADDYDEFVATHGQLEINVLVEHLAFRLTTALPKDALLARCGECLFAAFIPRLSEPVAVRTWACSVIDMLRTNSMQTGEKVTCSIGLSATPNGTPQGLAIMYRRALRALTIAKLNGGDGFLLYDTVRNEVKDSIEVFGVQLRHAVDGELLPERALEGKGLFEVISRDFENNRDVDIPLKQRRSVRDAVFGALRYRSMAEVPGILSFDYDVTDDTMFFESVGSDGKINQRTVRGFHKILFELEKSITEESMARLSALLSDLEYLPVAGNVDLKCRLNQDQEFRWYRFSFTSLRDDQSYVIRGLGYGEDIDLSRESGLWWKDRAMHDGLTGLLNREGLEDAAESKLSKQPGGIMFMVDVDDFTAVNETLGHLSGDSVLCEMADTLQAMFRDHDVVGRFGSDQMIAFIPGYANRDLAVSRSQAILKMLGDITVGSYGKVTVSVGTAILEQSHSFYDFLELCSHGVKLAKEAGKNTYKLLDETSRDCIHRLSLSAESRHSDAVRRELEHLNPDEL